MTLCLGHRARAVLDRRHRRPGRLCGAPLSRSCSASSSRCGCAGCAPRSASLLGDAERDLVAARRRVAAQLRGPAPVRRGRRAAAARPRGDGRGTPRRRDRLPRARALRRLQRAVGAPVDVDRTARRVALRDRPELDRPPRPGADLRQAGRRRRAASCSSRPRRRRPCASRWPARHAGRGRAGRTLARCASGTWGRRARSARRRCGPARRPMRRRSATRRSTTSRRRSRPATVERGLVPIENSLEGSVNATLDALTADDSPLSDRRRDRAGDHAVPDRARRGGARGDRGGHLAPPGARAVRAVPARASCPARGCSPPARRPRRRGPWRPSDEPWAAIGPRRAAEIYGRRGPARGDRGRRGQRDALRLAGADADADAVRAGRRGAQDVDRVRRRRRRDPGLARALPDRAVATAAST